MKIPSAVVRQSLISFVGGSFLAVLVGTCCYAQEAPIDQVSRDHIDAIVYRMIFRSAATYKKMYDEAKLAGEDKSYLRQILPERFSLKPEDAASLERIAIDHEIESSAVHAEIRKITAQFRERYATGQVYPGGKPERPAELATLQAREDAVTLHHRDSLRNAMAEPEFQRLESNIGQIYVSSSKLTISGSSDAKGLR